MNEERSEDARDLGRDRSWYAVLALVALVALAARIHNAFAYPPLLDFDGPGHAENTLALYRGELPDVFSWAGFHPPLHYAVGAALWWLVPLSVPLHTTLRLLSAAATAGMAFLVWRGLRRFAPEPDAAATAVFVLSAPVVTMAGSMVGNEATCAFLVTVALLRLTALPRESAALPRHAAVTALPLALAALTKSTGLIAIATGALIYAARARQDARRAVNATALLLAICGAALLPHYVHLLREGGGSPLSVISGAALGREARAQMASQPPGVRHISDYVFVPAAAWLAPIYVAPGLERSVPGLLWASTFADGHGQFLPIHEPGVLTAAAAISVAGLLPAALALLGIAQLARAPQRFAAAAGPLLYGAILVASLLVYVWIVPAYSAVKASYLLSAAFPAALLVAAGLGGLGGVWRSLARAGLLAVSLGSSLVLWYGWWAR